MKVVGPELACAQIRKLIQKSRMHCICTPRKSSERVRAHFHLQTHYASCSSSRDIPGTARAGKRRFWYLSALRAHTKAPYAPEGPDRVADFLAAHARDVVRLADREALRPHVGGRA